MCTLPDPPSPIPAFQKPASDVVEDGEESGTDSDPASSGGAVAPALAAIPGASATADGAVQPPSRRVLCLTMKTLQCKKLPERASKMQRYGSPGRNYASIVCDVAYDVTVATYNVQSKRYDTA